MFDFKEISEIVDTYQNGFITNKDIQYYIESNIINYDSFCEALSFQQQHMQTHQPQHVQQSNQPSTLGYMGNIAKRVALGMGTSWATVGALNAIHKAGLVGKAAAASKAALATNPVAAGAAGAAGLGYLGYKAYKHLKMRKQMNNTHNAAVNAAMQHIGKTHAHLTPALKPFISAEVKNVVNGNKDEFKNNPNEIHNKIVKTFQTNEFKKKMLNKAGLG